MEPSEKYIVSGTIVNPDGSILNDAGILVNGNRIEEIDKFAEIQERHPDLDILGSPEKIVIPGFVNTHSHAVQTLFRGAADDLELLDWLNQVILPGEATLRAEELYASCRIGYAEMLMSGITTTNDMLTVRHSQDGLRAAYDSGIRGKIGKMLMDRNAPEALTESKDSIMNELYTLSELYPKGGRIEFSVTPRFIITCTDELMMDAAQFAKDKGLLFHTHVAENLAEVSSVKRMTGLNYFEAMNKFGALHAQSIFAHCVWPAENELDLISTSKINISHNPSSNGKLSSGVAPIPQYLAQGNNVGLATDGSPATGGHDMFLEMKLASYFQKAKLNDPTIMPAIQIFDMATRMGARALGYSDIGLIKEGYKADIVILSTSSPRAHPMYNPISYIVYTATKGDVDTVIVDGRVKVQNGQLLDDMSEYYSLAKKYALERPFQSRSS